jgi:hypothetical protein
LTHVARYLLITGLCGKKFTFETWLVLGGANEGIAQYFLFSRSRRE